MLEHVRELFVCVHGGTGGMDTYPGGGSLALNARGGLDGECLTHLTKGASQQVMEDILKSSCVNSAFQHRACSSFVSLIISILSLILRYSQLQDMQRHNFLGIH